MSEENNQELNEEQNTESEQQEEQTVINGKVRYNPEKDDKEWKKMLVITIAAFLGGLLAILFIGDRMNHKKAEKESAAKEAAAHFAKKGQELSEEERIALEKDHDHKFRIDEYEMTYNDEGIDEDVYEDGFVEKQIKKEQNKIKKEIGENDKIRPVTVSAILKGENYIITVEAENFSDDEIKYKLNSKTLTVYGKTTIIRDGFERELEFSNDVYLPAKPKTELIKTYHEGENLIISVPLDIDE